jgi:Zn-dependent protease with chaperone function
MGSTTSVELLAQAIFHGLFAAIFVEALVRGWRVDHPGQRLALRLVALGYPLAVFPALVTLVPARAGEDFQEAAALLDGRRWDDLRFLGAGLMRWWTAGLAAAGAGLLLLDLVPFVRRRRAPRPAVEPLEPERARALAQVLAPLAGRLGIRPPSVVHLATDAPLLYCRGIRRPELILSRGTLRLLAPDELDAALAHELCHLARRDPAASWGLLVARVLMAFSPGFQVMARAVARDAESLADERAAALGDRVALASAVLKLYRAGAHRSSGRAIPFAAALARLRAAEVEVRCRRLLAPAPAPLPFGPVRVALAGLSLTGVLFFVV